MWVFSLTMVVMYVLMSVVMSLQTMAPTWVTSDGSDGLTTNGVVVMHPQGYFEPGVVGGAWQEVTVMGNMRKLRAKRSSRTPGEPVSGGWARGHTTNKLIEMLGITAIC